MSGLRHADDISGPSVLLLAMRGNVLNEIAEIRSKGALETFAVRSQISYAEIIFPVVEITFRRFFARIVAQDNATEIVGNTIASCLRLSIAVVSALVTGGRTSPSPSRAFYARDLHIAVIISQINGNGEALVFAFGIAHLPGFAFTIAVCRDRIAISVDGQGIVVFVRLHVIFPTVDTDAEREARSRHGRDGIGVYRPRRVGKLVRAGHFIFARCAVDVFRCEQIDIISLNVVAIG